MPRLSRSLTLTAVAALALTAGAAPALASAKAPAASPTPLVQSIDTLQPGTDLNLDENLLQSQGDRAAIRALVLNAAARERAANTVAGIPAPIAQQGAKAEWLSGIRLGVREDIEMAQATYDILDGQRETGMAAMHALNSVTNRVDTLIAHADDSLRYAPAKTADARSLAPAIAS